MNDIRDEYDFSGSRRGPIVKGNKERITIRLDPEIIEWFRTQEQGGENYQTLINLNPAVTHAKAPSSPRNTIG